MPVPYDCPALPDFIPGLELARAFYEDVVSEILGDTPHAAGRIGWGSDVLGFDTERSPTTAGALGYRSSSRARTC